MERPSCDHRFYIHGYVDTVTSIAYSIDGSSSVSAGHDATIQIFDARTTGLLSIVEPAIGTTLRCLAYSSDVQRIVAGNKE